MRIYQNKLNPVAEVDSFSNITTRFVYGSCANIPDYLIKDNVDYKYITDHLGSMRFVVNLTTLLNLPKWVSKSKVFKAMYEDIDMFDFVDNPDVIRKFKKKFGEYCLV